MAFDESSVTITFNAQDENVVRVISSIEGVLKRLGSAADETRDKVVQSTSAWDKVVTGVFERFGHNISDNVIGTLKSAAGSIERVIDGVMDKADSLTNMSAKTGIATESLQRLDFVAARVGVSLGEISNGMSRLQRSLGSGTAGVRSALRELGLSMADIKAMSPEEQLSTIVERLAAMEDPGKKAALSVTLLGRAGQSLVPLGAGLREATRDADRLGIVTKGQTVAAIDDLGDALGDLTKTTDAFRDKMVQAFLADPNVKAVVQGVTESVGSMSVAFSGLPKSVQVAVGGLAAFVGLGLKATDVAISYGASFATIASGMPQLIKYFGDGKTAALGFFGAMSFASASNNIFGKLNDGLALVGTGIFNLFKAETWKAGYNAIISSFTMLQAQVASTATAVVASAATIGTALAGLAAGALVGTAIRSGSEKGGILDELFGGDTIDGKVSSMTERLDHDFVRLFTNAHEIEAMNKKANEEALSRPGRVSQEQTEATKEQIALADQLFASEMALKSAAAARSGSISAQVAVMREQADQQARLLDYAAEQAKADGDMSKASMLAQQASNVRVTSQINASKMLRDATNAESDAIRALHQQIEDLTNRGLDDLSKQLLGIQRDAENAQRMLARDTSKSGGAKKAESAAIEELRKLREEAAKATAVENLMGKSMEQASVAASAQANIITGLGDKLEDYNKTSLANTISKLEEMRAAVDPTSATYQQLSAAIDMVTAALHKKGGQTAREIEQQERANEVARKTFQTTLEYRKLLAATEVTEAISGRSKAVFDRNLKLEELGSRGLDKDTYDALREDITGVKKETVDWGAAVTQVADSFELLGLKAGSALGSIVGGIALGITGLAKFADRQKEIKRLRDEGLNDEADAMARNDKIMGGVGGIGAAAAIWQQNSQERSGSKRLASGAMSGASAGAAFGPWGAAIGGVAGALLGFFSGSAYARMAKDAGKKLGMEVSDELAKAIDKTMKDLDVDVGTAALLNLDQAMAESGKGVAAFGTQIHDLMNLQLPKDSKAAAEQVKQVGAAFNEVRKAAEAAGTVGDRMTVQMIQHARAAGLKIGEITAFVKSALDKAIAGVTKMTAAGIGTLGQGGGGLTSKDQRRIETLRVKLTDKEITKKEFDDLLADIKQKAKESDVTLYPPERAKSQGAIFAAVFWGKFKEDGALAALEAMQPAYENLMKTFEAAGIDAGSVLGPITTLFGLMGESTKPVLEGIQGLDDALKGLADSGYMTRGAFEGFQTEASAAFADLQQKLMDQGMSAGDAQAAALAAIAPMLGNIAQVAEQYGLTLDENTRKLIEQAEASGIAFPTDPMQQVVDLLKEMVILLGGAVPDAARRAQSALSGVNMPDIGDGGGNGGPGPKSGGTQEPQGAAFGDLIPISAAGTLRRVGEGGNPNAELIGPVKGIAREIGAGLAQAGGAGAIKMEVGGITIVAQPGMDPTAIGNAVIAALDQNLSGITDKMKSKLLRRDV